MTTQEEQRGPTAPASDFQALLDRIRILAAGPAPDAGRQQTIGWEKAMESVAAITGTYRPEYMYQVDLGFGGLQEIEVESIEALRRNGHTVHRRVVGPWELYTGTPE